MFLQLSSRINTAEIPLLVILEKRLVKKHILRMTVISCCHRKLHLKIQANRDVQGNEI